MLPPNYGQPAARKRFVTRWWWGVVASFVAFVIAFCIVLLHHRSIDRSYLVPFSIIWLYVLEIASCLGGIMETCQIHRSDLMRQKITMGANFKSWCRKTKNLRRDLQTKSMTQKHSRSCSAPCWYKMYVLIAWRFENNNQTQLRLMIALYPRTADQKLCIIQ